MSLLTPFRTAAFRFSFAKPMLFSRAKDSLEALVHELSSSVGLPGPLDSSIGGSGRSVREAGYVEEIARKELLDRGESLAGTSGGRSSLEPVLPVSLRPKGRTAGVDSVRVWYFCRINFSIIMSTSSASRGRFGLLLRGLKV